MAMETISGSDVNLRNFISTGNYVEDVFGATLKLQTGEILNVAALRVFRSKDIHEVKSIKKLQHKHVIKYYGVVSYEWDSYILAELAENGTLRYYLDEWKKNENTSLSPEFMQRWAYETACGIRYLHECGYQHNTLGSINCFITKDLTLKLGDLSSTETCTFTRRAGDLLGKIRWMAPEVIQHGIRSMKSHVYSYGVIVWEIITTDVPFSKIKGCYHTMLAIIRGERPPICSDCPPALNELVQHCWQEDPDKRPAIEAICESFEKKLSL